MTPRDGDFEPGEMARLFDVAYFDVRTGWGYTIGVLAFYRVCTR